MKKLFSILLSAALLVSVLSCTASANDYPQSAHNYENNTRMRWTYTHPEPADCLYVTFSAQSCLAYTRRVDTVTADDPEEKIRDFMDDGFLDEDEREQGDRLYVYDAQGDPVDCFDDDSLAGYTLRIPGSSFSLELVTDGQKTAYGFSIDRISTQVPDDIALIRFHGKDNTLSRLQSVGETVRLPYSQGMQQDGNRILVGWETADGNAWYYNVAHYEDEEWVGFNDTDCVVQGGREYDFYPIYADIAMTKDEVFSFTNGDNGFGDRYHFMRTHYARLFPTWFTTFAFSPEAPLAFIAHLYITLIWPTLHYDGSCCGFPVLELMQHYGKIDLLSRQGAQTLAQLQPDEELLSTISYYNVNAAACHLVNHVGIVRGSAAYSEQLHALYETLASGKPVYFEFYPFTRHPMHALLDGTYGEILAGSHGILLTGAYTDHNGNHILIACDCNHLHYAEGTCDIAYINEDFTEIYTDSFGIGPLDGFSWNETIDQFDAFALKGVSNPFAYHFRLIKNGFSTLRQMAAYLSAKNAAK